MKTILSVVGGIMLALCLLAGGCFCLSTIATSERVKESEQVTPTEQPPLSIEIIDRDNLAGSMILTIEISNESDQNIRVMRVDVDLWKGGRRVDSDWHFVDAIASHGKRRQDFFFDSTPFDSVVTNFSDIQTEQ